MQICIALLVAQTTSVTYVQTTLSKVNFHKIEFTDEKREEALCIFCRRHNPILRNVDLLEKIKKYEDHNSYSASVLSENDGKNVKKIVVEPAANSVCYSLG
jgi:hypothetical protein